MPELQGEPEDISKEKARLAALQVHKLLPFSITQFYYLYWLKFIILMCKCVSFIVIIHCCLVFLLVLNKLIQIVFHCEWEGKWASASGGYMPLFQCFEGSPWYVFLKHSPLFHFTLWINWSHCLICFLGFCRSLHVSSPLLMLCLFLSCPSFTREDIFFYFFPMCNKLWIN